MHRVYALLPYFTFPHIKKPFVFLWKSQLSFGCDRTQIKNCHKAPCFQGLAQGHPGRSEQLESEFRSLSFQSKTCVTLLLVKIWPVSVDLRETLTERKVDQPGGLQRLYLRPVK